MANLGVRSYANSMLMENLFKQKSMPDLNRALKSFSTKILMPSVKIVEDNCGTLIGRNVSADDDSMMGLLALDTDTLIDDAYLVEKYTQGIYTIRVRDTSACTSPGGICRRCLHGTFVRLGFTDTVPAIGTTVRMPTDPESYINYLGNTYGGSLLGVSPLPADPLPIRPDMFASLVTSEEMDTMVSNLQALKVPDDEIDYLNTIHDKLERAFMIVAYYGVYGNAFRK